MIFSWIKMNIHIVVFDIQTMEVEIRKYLISFYDYLI